MEGGGAVNGFDPIVRFAALDERVTNLSGRLNSLDANMSRSFSQLEASLSSLSGEFSKSRQPQWQAIGVAVSAVGIVLSVIGYLTFSPISASIGEVKASMAQLSHENISPEERAYRTERNAEDRAVLTRDLMNIRNEINAVRASTVPMSQWEEQIKGRDMQISDLARARDMQVAAMTERFDSDINTLRDSIEALQQAMGNTYSARDVIMDLRAQVDDLRRRVMGP
jgi:hypothetical protein